MNKKRMIIALSWAFLSVLTLVLAATTTRWGGDTTSTNNLTLELNFTHLTANDSSILIYLPFDRNNTLPLNLTYDYSQYGNDGRYQFPQFNNQIFWNNSEGPLGGYYTWRNRINGFGDDVIINISSFRGNSTITSRNFTVSFWARYDEPLGRQNDILGFWRSAFAGNNGTWGIQMGASGQLETSFRTNNGTSIVLGATSIITPGVWFHYAVVVASNTSGTVRQYVNGTVTSVTPLIADNYNNNSLPLKIGSLSSGVGQMWNGSIDEVVIYNRTLSDAEIAAIFANTSSRFVSPGEARYDNLNLTQTPMPTFLNITVNRTDMYGPRSNITIVVGSSNGSEYIYGSPLSQSGNTNNFINLPITGNNPNNISLKFLISGTQFSTYMENAFITSFGDVDTAPPSVIVNAPTSGQSYTADDLPIVVNVTTNETASLVYFILDGNNATNYTMSDALSGLAWNYSFMSLIASGSHHLRFYAYDLSNNVNDSVTVTFINNIQDPVISIASPLNNTNITSNTTTLFSIPVTMNYGPLFTFFSTVNMTWYNGNRAVYSGLFTDDPIITATNIPYGTYRVNVSVDNQNGFVFYTPTITVDVQRPKYFNLRNNTNDFWLKVVGNTTTNRSQARFIAFGDSMTSLDQQWTFFFRDKMEENTTGTWGFGYNALAVGYGQNGTNKPRFASYITASNTSLVQLGITNQSQGFAASTNDTYALNGIHSIIGSTGQLTLSTFGRNITVFYMAQPEGGFLNISNGSNAQLATINTSATFREARNITFASGASNATAIVNLTFKLVGANDSNPMWTQLNGLITESQSQETGIRFDRAGRTGEDISLANIINETAFNTTVNRLDDDLIFVMFDDNFLTYLPSYYSNVTQFVRRLKAANPEAGIVLVTHLNWTRVVQNETEMYINISINENVGFINFFDLYTQDQLNSTGLFADFIHMSAAGGSTFGNYTWSLIQQENNLGSLPSEAPPGGGGGGGGGTDGGGSPGNGVLHSFQVEFPKPFDAGKNNTFDVFTYDVNGNKIFVDSVFVNFTDYPTIGYVPLTYYSENRYSRTFFIDPNTSSQRLHITVIAKKGANTITQTYEGRIESIADQSSPINGVLNNFGDAFSDVFSGNGDFTDFLIVILTFGVLIYVGYLLIPRS